MSVSPEIELQRSYCVRTANVHEVLHIQNNDEHLFVLARLVALIGRYGYG